MCHITSTIVEYVFTPLSLPPADLSSRKNPPKICPSPPEQNAASTSKSLLLCHYCVEMSVKTKPWSRGWGAGQLCNRLKFVLRERKEEKTMPFVNQPCFSNMQAGISMLKQSLRAWFWRCNTVEEPLHSAQQGFRLDSRTKRREEWGDEKKIYSESDWTYTDWDDSTVCLFLSVPYYSLL